MTIRTKLGAVAAIAMASALVSACSSTPKNLPVAPGGSTTSSTNDGSMGIVPGSQADFLNFTMGADVIYFDTDRFNIDSADAAALQTQAQWLQRYPAKRATIEGHCDERGTRDYNLALGERRANAAKNYLVGLGIDAARLNLISYGKERPVALGSDESSWSKNRRAVTVTID